MPQRQQDPSPDDGRRHGPRWKVVNTPTCPLHGHAGILGTGDKVSPDTVLLVFYAHSTIMVISGRASAQSIQPDKSTSDAENNPADKNSELPSSDMTSLDSLTRLNPQGNRDLTRH